MEDAFYFLSFLSFAELRFAVLFPWEDFSFCSFLGEGQKVKYHFVTVSWGDVKKEELTDMVWPLGDATGEGLFSYFRWCI